MQVGAESSAARGRALRGALPAFLAALVCLGSPPAGASAASVETFSKPAKGWRADGGVRLGRGFAGDNRSLRAVARSRPGTVRRRLGVSGWRLSADLALDPATTLVVGLGDTRHALTLTRRDGRQSVTARVAREEPHRVAGVAGPAGPGWVHLQAASRPGGVELAVGGLRLRLPRRARNTLSLSIARGGMRVDDVIVSRRSDRLGLLLHRLADLNARVPPRRFIVGADGNDGLWLRTRFWTRGYLAGALWRASALAGGGLFEEAALARTVANLGYEAADSHDVGLIYENSSLAALRLACRPPVRSRRRAACERFAGSGLAAARSLLTLAETNPGGGTIPTRAFAPSASESDTIVDSLMNLPLLYWASDSTGDPRYREVAARHARRVMALLQRPDGSTTQSVHMDRRTGQVTRLHSHQGISPESTWSRGQGWAVYGFAASAAALGDRELARAAERAARWVAGRLPASGIPPYDYDAPDGAPPDVSAGVITAAGMFRLADLCRDVPGACEEPGRWRPVAVRMLRRALERASTSLPLGFLGNQVGTFRGDTVWDDQAEMIYGLNYGVEALARSRGRAALP